MDTIRVIQIQLLFLLSLFPFSRAWIQGMAICVPIFTYITYKVNKK